MEEIQNHIILFLSSVILAAYEFPTTKKFIVIMLIVFCIDALLILYGDYKKVQLSLMLTYYIICVFMPIALIYLPVMIYWNFKYCRFSFFIIAAFIVGISKVLLESKYLPLYCLLLVGSYLLERRTTLLLRKEQEYRVLRDTSVEYSETLKMKNRELIKKQDNEIYVATLLERNRIAREIHDNVGHMLSRAILLLGAMISINQNESVNEGLVQLKETLDQAMNGIRASVHDLHDESVDLKNSIEKLVNEFKFAPVDLDYDMGRKIPKNVKYCFIALVKEALSNIIRHSNATKVEVIVREHPGIYQLLIQDNGTTELNSSVDGMGLNNMRERVDAMQGTITITSENGYRIFVSIPKPNKKEAHK